MSNTVIAIRSSGVASNTPSLGVLANGEIALNYADGIIYYKTDANTLGQIKTTEPSGLDTEIQFNDSGSFGSNASFIYRKELELLSTVNFESINVTAENVDSEVLVTNTYIQFGDGSRQYTANAGDAGLTDQYARDHANGAFDAANTALTTATDQYARDHANGAFDAANTTATNLSTAEGRLDFAYTHANNAFDAANTSQTTADGAFTAANTAQSHAEGAFTQANTNAGNISTNTTNITSAYNHANGAFDLANGTAGVANTDVTNVSVSADTYGNASAIPSITIASNGRITAVTTNSIDTTTAGLAYDHANGAFDAANTAQTHADGAFDAANTNATNITTAQNTADGAFTAANNAQTHAESAYSTANTNATNITTAQNHADGAFDAANTAQTTADAAFGQANTATTNASTAQTTADGAYAHANGAFDSANTKFASAGGTVSGFVNVTQNVSVGSYVDLNTAPSNPTHSEGRLFYDNTQKSLAYYNEDSEMTLQIGQETVVRVYNKSGATINNASVVRITGSDGAGFPAISLADATSAVNSEVIGVTTTEIANDSYGYVTTDGKVSGVDTSLLSDGAELFLSTTPGEYTTTVPATPNIAQAVGYVSSVGASGSILVNLHPMTGRNMTDGSIIFAENGGFDQDNADLYWDNTNHRLGINTNTPSANLHVVGTGLFTGNVEILGNLIITNAEAITTTTLNVGGNTIVLSDEVSGEPTVNAEIVINRGSSDNVSIRWDETTDEWVLIEASGVEGHILSDAKTFQSWNDYATAETYEKAGYPIGADLANATHQQAVTANNLAALAQTVGQGAYNHANGAFTAANTAQSTADGAQTHAEGAFTQANTNAGNISTNTTNITSAYNHANGAFTAANTAQSTADGAQTHAEGAFSKANTNATNITTAQNTADGAFSLANGTAIIANTDVTNISAPAGSYGNATFVPVITLASNGRISTISTQEITGGGATNVTVSSFATTANGLTSTYNLDFTPVDEESLIVSLDGVLQQPTSAYTVSGNVITFASAPASTVNVVVTSFYTDVATYAITVEAGVQTTAENAYAHANGAFDKANTALVSADIGSTVQAYDADTTKNDVTNTFTVDQLFSANVGIGTITPSNTLHVKSAQINAGLVESTDANFARLQFKNAGTTNNPYIGTFNNELRFNTTSADMVFQDGVTEKMRLTSAGGVAYNGSSNYGTTGQVLTSNGNAPPTWEDASAGITTGKAIAMAIVFG